MESKHTKGECTYSPMKGTKNHCYMAQVWDSNGFNLASMDSRYGEEESTANAKLTAEAFNVANETGKTPRQLANENKMLIDAMERIKIVYDNIEDMAGLTARGVLDSIYGAEPHV